jgi:hypothetical protein
MLLIGVQYHRVPMTSRELFPHELQRGSQNLFRWQVAEQSLIF